MSLLAATRSEVTKVLTTSTWWILAVVLVAYVGSTAGGLSWLFGALQTGALPTDATTGAPPIAPGTLAPTMYSVASSIGYVFPLLIGTLMATSEFRHQTLTPTFLATPRRGVALGGKLAAALLIGALYALVAIIAVVVPSALVFASLGTDTGLGTADTWWCLARAFAALIPWALIGGGLGAWAGAVLTVVQQTQSAGKVHYRRHPWYPQRMPRAIAGAAIDVVPDEQRADMCLCHGANLTPCSG